VSGGGGPDRDAERARLFVALDLPADVHAALEHWQARVVRDLRGLRAVARGALHATLCFLGWRLVDEIEQIGAACVHAVGGSAPPRLTFTEPLWLPERRPRVLAVGLADTFGTLAGIQAALSAALNAGGWYALETRPFLAHVTVARVARGARVRPVEVAPLEARGFEAAAVTLYRSRLERAGARYEPLREIRFGCRSSAS
jgi:2'-5' RNA ligase